MNSVNPATDRLELPRQLINRLLHVAQSMPDAIHWGLIGADNGIPLHCYPIADLNAGQLAAARDNLMQRGETLFAIYRSDPDRILTPGSHILDELGIEAPYLLSISLGTKGVLQLRGWRIDSGQPTALDVGISES